MEQKRKPKKDDFAVDIEGIGSFMFRYRTMRDEFRIRAEYSRLTEGVLTPDMVLIEQANIFATLSVLTVEAPKGWDLSEMDPLDPKTFETVERVYKALRDKEDFFRKGAVQGSQAPSKTDGGDDGVLGEEEIQPGTD